MENLPIKDAASELRGVQKELEACRAEVRRLTAQLAEAGKARAVAEEERLERFRELAQMAELILQAQQELEAANDLKNWLHRLSGHLLSRPGWWSLLPQRRRRHLQHKAMRRENLFNAQEYFAAHPDVEASGMDPLRHFVERGIGEGRRRPIAQVR